MYFLKTEDSIRLITRLLMVLFISFTFAVAGCSDSDDDSDDGVDLITYQGETGPITITQGIAEDLVRAVAPMGLSTLTSTLTGGTGPDDSTRQSMQIVANSISRIDLSYLLHDESFKTASALDSYSESCPGGGTVAVTLESATDTAATGKIKYTNCIEDGDTLAGAISYTITYASESAFINDDWDGVSMTLDVVVLSSEDDSDFYIWFNNYTFRETAYTGYVEQTVSGRLFVSPYGYIDAATFTPFRIDTGASYPSEGVMTVSGGQDTQARLTALEESAGVYSYTVEFDDGSGFSIIVSNGTW